MKDMMMKTLIVLALVLIASSFGVNSVCGQSGPSFHVDATLGSNSAGTGGASSPWQTITFAVSQVPSPARIFVRSGFYDTALGEVFPIQPAAGISIIGTGATRPKVQPALPAFPPMPSCTFEFTNGPFGSDTRLEHLWLDGACSASHILQSSPVSAGNRLVVKDVLFTGFAGGVKGSGVEVIDCHFQTAGGVWVPGGPGNTILAVVRGCLFEGWISSAAIRIDAGPVIIERNILRNGGPSTPGFPTPTAIRLVDHSPFEPAGATRVSDNLITQNTCDGISGFSPGSSALGVYPQFKPAILNNTIVMNAGYGMRSREFFDPWNPLNQTEFKMEPIAVNNILKGNALGDVFCIEGDFFQNRVDNPSAMPISPLQVAFPNTSADPQFLNEVQGDFHLSPGSPLIDAGLGGPLFIPQAIMDLDQRPRVLDGNVDGTETVDLGTFEFVPQVSGTVINFGTGFAGGAGIPVLTTFGGQPNEGNSAFGFQLQGGPPNGSWFINASGGPTASAGLVLPGGGVVWFDATAALLPLPGLLLPLGPGGFGSMPAALPAGVGLQGLSLWVQTLIVDPLNPSAVILSNGLQVVVGP